MVAPWEQTLKQVGVLARSALGRPLGGGDVFTETNMTEGLGGKTGQVKGTAVQRPRGSKGPGTSVDEQGVQRAWTALDFRKSHAVG